SDLVEELLRRRDILDRDIRRRYVGGERNDIQVRRRALEFPCDVETAAAREAIGVVAGAPVQQVVAEVAIQAVEPVVAVELVASRAAEQQVVAGHAEDRVVTGA